MAVQRDRITVFPPEGETVAVDILDTGVSIGIAHAERTTTRTLTLPATISARTSFYVPADSGPYSVSVKLDGKEIAGADGTAVTVSEFPAEVRTRINAAELGDVAGASGGSVLVGSVAGALVEQPNNYVPSSETMVVFTTDDDDVAEAFGITGEDFPRIIVTTAGNICWGDGTFDPAVESSTAVYFDGDNLWMQNPGAIIINSSDSVVLNGSTFRAVTGVPGGGVGANGDFAISTNGRFYFKVFGAWVPITLPTDGLLDVDQVTTGALSVGGGAASIDGAGNISGLVGDFGGGIHAVLPTADPAVAGYLWNDAGTVKVSAG